MHERVSINIPNSKLLYSSLTQVDSFFKPIEHSHPNLEVLLIHNGEGTIKTINKEYKVKRGDVVFINPNIMHVETSKDKLYFSALGFNKSQVFEEKKIKNNILIFSLKNDEFNELENLFESIQISAKNKTSNYSKKIKKYEEILFMNFNDFEDLYFGNFKKQKESDLVANIKLLIDLNYTNGFTLEEIAKQLNTCESKICHEFKKETNMSIFEYKIKKQLEEAKNLLTISDMKVSEIAYLTGFNNVSYFNKVFKKEYGITPLKYKSNI